MLTGYGTIPIIPKALSRLVFQSLFSPAFFSSKVISSLSNLLILLMLEIDVHPLCIRLYIEKVKAECFL
jgi:hypothetical protein